MFGDNLRQLAKGHSSIVALSRELGINRTQFNRYLSGDSFPRPDVLCKICNFFGTDARILTQPLDQIQPETYQQPPLDLLGRYFGPPGKRITESELPTGLYHVVRESFLFPSRYLRSIVHVCRDGNTPFLRGYEPGRVLARLNIRASAGERVYLGPIVRRGQGYASIVGSRLDHGVTFRYFAPYEILNRKLWSGLIVEPTQERPTAQRASRTVMEFLPRGVPDALPLARKAPLFEADELGPVYTSLLHPGQPFT